MTKPILGLLDSAMSDCLCRSLLSIAFISAGNTVTGSDIDVEKAEKLNAGQTCINHIGAYSVREMLETGRFSTSADFTALEKNFYHMLTNLSH
jgi:UDP-N-acetyl-D-mannosaminuronate dehydrogenase